MDVFFSISQSLAGHMLNYAFALLRPWVRDLGTGYLSDRLQSLQRNYQYAVDYYLAGNDDPHREEVMDSLIREAFILLDEVYMEKRLRDSHSYEFIHMAQADAQHLSPVVESNDSIAGPVQVFNFFWLRRDLQDWELDILDAYIANPEMEDEALMGISGLTLNLLRSFSEVNILRLLRACSAEKAECVRERAWVALFLVLLKYDIRLRFFPSIVSALQDTLDSDDSQVFARTALSCLIRTQGVEWASRSYRSFQEKLMPLIAKNMPTEKPGNGVLTTDDLDDFGSKLGSEFESIMEEQRKVLERLQEEHLDTNFAMFSGMYTSSFFSEPYRWWLPYSADYLPSEQQKQSARFVESLPFMDVCDSDKYAFISVLSNAGVQNGENLSINPENMQLATGSVLCNPYMQQAYRFFRLNPWGIEDPFELVDTLPDTQLFRLLNPTGAEKRISADHFLRCRAFVPAIAIYEDIVSSVPSAELYRNYGLALQKNNNYEEAVLQYNEALALESDEWTLRQKAFCFSRLERYDDALVVMEQLLLLVPDSGAYQYEKAKCLEHLELYAEALDMYYKLALYMPENAKVMRSIAWCAFLCDMPEEAEKYYDKLLSSGKAQPIDFLNNAHLCFVQGKRMDAFAGYQQVLRLSGTLKDFLRLFRPDRKILLEKGISKPDIYMMEDQIIRVSQSLEE